MSDTTCEDCGRHTSAPVEPHGISITLCQQCYQHWDGDAEHDSPVVRWEQHIAEENPARNVTGKQPDRRCTISTATRGQAMFGKHTSKIVFLGIDTKGRIIVHNQDRGDVDLLVPRYLKGFAADFEQLAEREADLHGRPRPYEALKPPHGGPHGFDPLILTPDGRDHLYRYDSFNLSRQSAADVLVAIAAHQGLTGLSTAGYQLLIRATADGSSEVATEYQPPLPEATGERPTASAA